MTEARGAAKSRGCSIELNLGSALPDRCYSLNLAALVIGFRPIFAKLRVGEYHQGAFPFFQMNSISIILLHMLISATVTANLP